MTVGNSGVGECLHFLHYDSYLRPGGCVSAIGAVDDLTSRCQQLDQRCNNDLNSLTEELRDEIVYKMRTHSGRGRRHGTKQADVLLDVGTHAQYTTAQLVNMLRHLGQTRLPDVMLIALARQEAWRNTSHA